MTMATSIDAMFKRKRGRPPKNRVIEVSPREIARHFPSARRPKFYGSMANWIFPKRAVLPHIINRIHDIPSRLPLGPGL